MNTRSLVPVLDTAIRILYELANNPGEATSAGLARQVDASQPTCYRILKTLEAAGECWRPYRSVASWYLWRASELSWPA